MRREPSDAQWRPLDGAELREWSEGFRLYAARILRADRALLAESLGVGTRQVQLWTSFGLARRSIAPGSLAGKLIVDLPILMRERVLLAKAVATYLLRDDSPGAEIAYYRQPFGSLTTCHEYLMAFLAYDADAFLLNKGRKLEVFVHDDGSTVVDHEYEKEYREGDGRPTADPEYYWQEWLLDLRA